MFLHSQIVFCIHAGIFYSSCDTDSIKDELLTDKKRVLVISHIDGRSRGPWPFLKFKTLHRNSIFAIENHLSLAKWPP